MEFLNEKAGTFRAPGGGLNALAGIVPSLDSVVEKLRTNPGDKAYDELYKMATKAKEAYADYYAKVAKKLQENKGYAEKEFNRLSNMINKGGLAPEKLDDLVSRSNILRKFMPEEDTEEKSEL